MVKVQVHLRGTPGALATKVCESLRPATLSIALLLCVGHILILPGVLYH